MHSFEPSLSHLNALGRPIRYLAHQDNSQEQ